MTVLLYDYRHPTSKVPRLLLHHRAVPIVHKAKVLARANQARPCPPLWDVGPKRIGIVRKYGCTDGRGEAACSALVSAKRAFAVQMV